MLDRLEDLGLRPLRVRGRKLLPIVQGGMGVGVSAHRLASAVAREGAMGTIASVDLRHHHPDLMAAGKDVRDRVVLDRQNLVALDREIRMAREQSQGRGAIAVNVMKAVDQHAALVRQSCESGADAIVMGAGLPLDLPEMCAGFPQVALVPILSDARGVAVVLKRWQRKGRLPDAIVIEHPAYAGGHLGATRIEDLKDPRFEFDRVIEEVQALFREQQIESERIPLIAAGGISTPEKLRNVLKLGYAAAQLGTAFAVTEEGDAHVNFKKVLAGAKPQDIVEFVSVAGLPARAVKTVWLERYLRREHVLQAEAAAFEEAHKGKPVDRIAKCSGALQCLTVCGLRDGIAKIGQFCIDTQLAAAMRGELSRGLFFRGASTVPFGTAIRPVRELIDYMLTGSMPAALESGAMAAA
ncbi:MAG: nitronate monooxygenase family protein [Burkholderiaceae bacterium]|jgi:nitronate monooxygenase|nr:nitronate monooxygenase family protein [Burkholderiaceae bacterium]MDH5208100.1 nitronate monooxygenase family protein [Burkholderiaceae bacterium]